jgi:hypothetical protein
MNKAYYIWPMIGVLVFAAFYWNFSLGYAVEQKKKADQAETAQKEKSAQEIERRREAVVAANKAQEERRIARAIRDKREQDENDTRSALMERRQRAFDEVNRHLRPQLDRQKGDADTVKGDIAQLELQKKQFVDEETFIRKYTRQAEANVKTYYDLLDKVKAAEDAHAAAAAEAAKAAKKPSD